MKVAIVGAGVVGCNVGGHLKMGGAEVYFVDPNRAHMEAVAEKGLYWTLQDESQVGPIAIDGAMVDSSPIGVCDVVLIIAKCMYTRDCIEQNPGLFGENTLVISLMNGVGTADILAEYFPPERVGYGFCLAGGAYIEPGHTRMNKNNNGVNVVFKRMAGGKNELCQQLEDICAKADFPIEYTDDADYEIWKKLGVNCMGNLTGGITRLTMYDTMNNPHASELVEKIVDEVVAVAHAQGIMVKKEEIIWFRQNILNTQYRQLASAAADMKRKARTEVDFLNGAVVRYGKKYGVPTPVNETITLLAHAIEDSYELQF